MSEKFDRILQQLSAEHGVPTSQILADMMEAIHAAYTNEDQDARQRFQMIFGNEEPTPEQFVMEITKLMGPSSELKH